MTMIDNGDSLGRKGRKTDLLQQGRHLVGKVEYYDVQIQSYRDWMTVINHMKDPMQLLFGLFDSLLSDRPAVAHKAEEQLSILLYQAPKLPKNATEEQTVRRAVSYFAQNSHNLAKKIEKQVVAGNQTAKDQAQNYVRLMERITTAFDDIKLYPNDATALLWHTLALWRWVSKRGNTPVKVAHQDETDAERPAKKRQPGPHARA